MSMTCLRAVSRCVYRKGVIHRLWRIYNIHYALMFDTTQNYNFNIHERKMVYFSSSGEIGVGYLNKLAGEELLCWVLLERTLLRRNVSGKPMGRLSDLEFLTGRGGAVSSTSDRASRDFDSVSCVIGKKKKKGKKKNGVKWIQWSFTLILLFLFVYKPIILRHTSLC